LFYQPWYLDTVCGASKWEVALAYRGDHLLGVWPYYIKSKWGLKYITMPSLTPYLGPFISIDPSLKNSSKYTIEKELLTSLCDQIPRALLTAVQRPPSMSNSLALHWAGYTCEKKYTYRIPLNSSSEIWDNIDTKQKNIIRKAQLTYTVEQINDVEPFLLLNNKTFERQGISVPYTADHFRVMDSALNEHKARTILVAYDKHNNMHGAIYVTFDSHTCYLIAIGSDPKERNLGSIPLLIWSYIEEITATKELFDFEGSMMPNIESFFRSFGGNLCTYDRVYKGHNRCIELLLRLTKKL